MSVNLINVWPVVVIAYIHTDTCINLCLYKLFQLCKVEYKRPPPFANQHNKDKGRLAKYGEKVSNNLQKNMNLVSYFCAEFVKGARVNKSNHTSYIYIN